MQTNTLKNVLAWIIKIGLLIIPFIPLYIAAGLFFPFITGKAFIFRGIVEIVFALWLVLMVFYKEFRPKKNSLLLAISIFIAVVILATVLGVNPLRSFWSNFERMEGLVMYVHLFMYFLVLGNVFKKRDWSWLFNAFVVSGLMQGSYALMQKFGNLTATQGGFRVDGTIGNPTYLAVFMMFVAGFCGLLFLKTKSIALRWYYSLAGAFSLMIIYFTVSRGPVLGILIGLFVALVGYLIFKKAETDSERKIKKVLLGGLIGLVVVVGVIYGLKDTNLIKNSQTLSRLTNLSFTETTVISRFTVWQMSWKGFLEKPILGWGPENYIAVFSKYYTPEMWNQEPWFDRSHNIVFDWLINAGILGLLSYLSIFALAFRELLKNFRANKVSFEELILVVGLFVAYFFQNLFVFDNIAAYISFFAVLAWIYSVSTEEKTAELEKERPVMDTGYFALVAGMVLLVGFFYAYHVNIKPYQQNKYLISAIVSANRKDFASSLEYYQKIVDLDAYLGRFEVRSQLINSAFDAFKDQNLPDAKKQEFFDLCVNELEDAKLQNPLDPRPFMYAGILYDTVNQMDKAIENMEAARKISPKKQDIAIDLSNFYINEKRYEEALVILTDTVESDKSNPNPKIYLAGLYVLMGDQNKADEILMEGFGKTVVQSEYLIKVYYSVKKYDKILEIWKSFVASQPENIDYRESLAGAYILNNQSDMAIKELRTIAEMDPSKASEMEQIITQILQENL